MSATTDASSQLVPEDEGEEAGGADDDDDEGVRQMVTLYRVHPQDVTRCKRVAFLGRYVLVGLSLAVLLLLHGDLSAPKCVRHDDDDDDDNDGGDSDVKCAKVVWWDYVEVLVLVCLVMPNAPIAIFNFAAIMADCASEPWAALRLWRVFLWPTVETDIQIKFYLVPALFIPLGCVVCVIDMLEANAQLPTWMAYCTFASLPASVVSFAALSKSSAGVVWADLDDRELTYVVSHLRQDRGWMTSTEDNNNGAMVMVPAVGRILRLTPIHYPLPRHQQHNDHTQLADEAEADSANLQQQTPT